MLGNFAYFLLSVVLISVSIEPMNVACAPSTATSDALNHSGFKLGPDIREKSLLPPGKFGRSDSQIFEKL